MKDKINSSVIFSECEKLSTKSSQTFPKVFNEVVEKFGNHPALMIKNPTNDEFIQVTYSEYKKRVEKVAKVFIKLGLEKQGSVAVLAFNSPEWFISQLASIYAGGSIVGIYTSNSSEVCQYILENTRANIVVVDDDEQLEKIEKIRAKLPHLKAIIKTLPSCDEKLKSKGFLEWKEIEQLNTDDFEIEYNERLQNIDANDCCCIVFTSGTTGNPKGAMLSHENFFYGVENISKCLNLKFGQEIFVSYLPLSHVAALFIDIFLSVYVSGTVYFADKNALKGTLIPTLAEVHPTFFFGVPRIFEKLHGYIEHLKSKLGGEKLKEVQKHVGLERAVLLTGAAPINIDTLIFFQKLKMPLFEAYGMTESTGIMFANLPNETVIGSVGKALPGIEAKIHNPNSDGIGEIWSRGRNTFQGYLNDIEKTRETVDEEGWLHSGDVGFIDKNGYLFITGRIKELIITAGGENIPYMHVENLIKSECSAISNTLLIGDGRKFLSILITLKTEIDHNGAPKDALAIETLSWLNSLGLKYTTLKEILNAGPDEKVLGSIQAAINRANSKSISNAQKVQKFAILPNDFSISTGELGPTMKLKRSVVIEKYKNLIDNLYKEI